MRRAAPAAAICLILAAAHTWPIAAAPHRHSLNYNADAQLNAWVVSWIPYALTHEPRHLFAGNIFQPDDRALAYSEPLVVPALAGAPIRWLGGSAVLTFNLLTIAGLAATALAGWWLAYSWTGSPTAGLVTGALTAFNTHLLTRLPHLQATNAWGLPLLVYLTDRLLRGPATRRVVLLWALTFAAIAMTSAYWFVFALVATTVQALVGPQSVRALRSLAAAAIAGILIASPILWPYARLAAAGTRRPIEQAAEFSASPSAYLVSASRIDALWSHRFFTRDIDVLFPGVAALGLALVGAVHAWRHGEANRRRTVALAAIAVAGVVLSLGPATPGFTIAFRIFFPLQGLRVMARFGYLLLLAVAVLAGFGTAALMRSVSSRAARAAIAIVILAVVTGEAWHAPIPVTPFTGVPSIYAVLDREPRPALLVEAPFWPAETVYGNGEYVLNATEHRTPIMNGYSGFTPDAYRRRAQWFWFFPEPWAIDAMRREGATHVMVHFEQFGRDAAAVREGLATQRGLELIAEDPRGHRLYRLSRSRP
jgi:hypothetical protein